MRHEPTNVTTPYMCAPHSRTARKHVSNAESRTAFRSWWLGGKRNDGHMEADEPPGGVKTPSLPRTALRPLRRQWLAGVGEDPPHRGPVTGRGGGWARCRESIDRPSMAALLPIQLPRGAEGGASRGKKGSMDQGRAGFGTCNAGHMYVVLRSSSRGKVQGSTLFAARRDRSHQRHEIWYGTTR